MQSLSNLVRAAGFGKEVTDECLPTCDTNYESQLSQATEELQNRMTELYKIDNRKIDFTSETVGKKYLSEKNRREQIKDICIDKARKAKQFISVDCMNGEKKRLELFQLASIAYEPYVKATDTLVMQQDFMKAGFSNKLFCLIKRYNAFKDVFKIHTNDQILETDKLNRIRSMLSDKINGVPPTEEENLQWLCEAAKTETPIPILFQNALIRACI